MDVSLGEFIVPPGVVVIVVVVVVVVVVVGVFKSYFYGKFVSMVLYLV